MKWKIFVVLIFLIIAIQFIPYGRNHVNPPVVSEPDWDSAQTRAFFVVACADCHSHETKWPWYSRVAPVSWLVQHDVQEGREHFNVSLWGVQKKNRGQDAADEVRDGDMPPLMYRLGHSEARLSDEGRGQFVRGLAATFPEREERPGNEREDD
ncbi:MAG TPA: heme-binding domain-containing protein [Thermoanaerobaculia bacterium]|nr:heme-binding domain-containing protein [Thermoanaerobaculia bacterium]HUM29233.1 heme-binding domain-containing protein [Thermoanaerobaculia bacterium]HXK67808.1 heme-binding domain-containing protein [Thermoanaerobaculia bacterium]